ncbi:peptidase domain-containing ABC transporter [Ideonella azotifigens]|uniref:Peptidase domain-containing ABC transporter n=3 Tax=Ideonella azotifigens TaxID=513160 RepID=A0ABN1JPF9_9BURK|nr:peptidase domain-containing ABC transporter [Ideonella azotifigens]MCD2340069.1 peptidase domain-containing ABC transporter [Ideonella azotifigens]
MRGQGTGAEGGPVDDSSLATEAVQPAEPRLRFGWLRPKVPLILQTEAAECGLACLAMIAGAHGMHTDLPSLRERFQISMKGATAADVADIGAAMGLTPRALRAEPEQFGQLALPCILHWDLNHFVVLAEFKRGVATVHDPARGVRRMRLPALSPHFSGVALEFTPGAGFHVGEARRPLRWRQLLGRVSGLKRALGQVLLLAVALELWLLLTPFFLQWVVDGVLVSGERDLLTTLGLGFAGLVLLQVLTAAARSWAVLHLSAMLKFQWLGNVFAHLLRLPMDWFERRHTGDIWSRFSAVQQIQDTLSTKFAEALIDGLMVLLTLALMGLYSPLLAAVAIGAVLLYTLLRWSLDGAMREASEEALVHEAKKASHFLESLRGVGAIKLFNGEAGRQSRFMNLVVDSMNAALALRRHELVMSVGQRLIFGLERVAVIWLGALAVLDQQFSAGMLFAFLAYQEQFATRASALVDKAGELRLLRLQGERLADIVLTPPEAALPGQRGNLPTITGRLTVQGLHFRYSDTEPEVLSGLSFEIAAGESVAIVGPSGCGKTTLLKLLLGIHEAQAGEVLIDGLPMARIGRQRWRSLIGTVMQDEPLFAGSIADNIAFFAPDADPLWVVECARLASVHEDIAAMPMGYATLVGDMGTTLSGGQKQRVLLARALYKRPRILLLDEATSALDVDRERLVNRAVQQLQLTRIIVAHRPETIASAQRVIVLQAGRVVQTLRTVGGVGGGQEA